MPEELTPEIEQRVLSAMAKTMIEHAIGMRDGSTEREFILDKLELGLLLSVDYFEGESPAVAQLDFTDDQLKALSSSADPLRHGSSAGPLCSIWESLAKQSVAVVGTPDGLVHSDSNVRNAICDYLTELTPHVGTAISEFSFLCFQQNEEAIRSLNPMEWYSAAITVLDALERDFLFHLAGFAQSLQLPENLKEHLDRYSRRILYPVETPAKHIHFEAFDVSADTETWQGRVKECVIDGHSTQTIQNYVGRFQHLPLSDPYSLATTIRNYFRISDAFQSLIDLAGSEHPLERFHGCQALCEAWSEWNEEEQTAALPVLDTFLHMMFADDLDSIDHQLWKCQLLLARHYLYQCELYEPGWHPDAVSALAWKLSDQVMRVIAPHTRAQSDPIEYLNRISDEIIGPALERGELLARTVRAPMFQSLYRLSTLHSAFKSPFGFSVLTSFEPLIRQYQRLQESNQCSGILTITFAKLVLSIGKFLPESRTVVFAQATENWERTLETWLQTQEPHRAYADDRIAQFQKLTDESELSATLEKLADADKETRTQTLFIMLQLARMDHLPPQSLWNALTDQTFREMLLGSLDIEDLMSFINTIVIVQQGTSPAWAQQLPQVFIDMLQTLAPTDEQADILVGSVIGSAVRAQAFSALRRIRHECRARPVAKTLETYAKLIRHVSKNAPRWTQVQIQRMIANFE